LANKGVLSIPNNQPNHKTFAFINARVQIPSRTIDTNVFVDFNRLRFVFGDAATLFVLANDFTFPSIV
jgi:hypothetical protein